MKNNIFSKQTSNLRVNQKNSVAHEWGKVLLTEFQGLKSDLQGEPDVDLIIEIISSDQCLENQKFFLKESMKKNNYLQWRMVSKPLGSVCETRDLRADVTEVKSVL